jgi:hypothetical protein
MSVTNIRGAHDVGELEAGVSQRLLDDLEHRSRLGRDVAGVERSAVRPASVVPATQHESPTTTARL